jgi:hypothetical protein
MHDAVIVTLCPYVTMNAADPDGPPRGGSVTKKTKKNPLPTVLEDALRRGPSHIVRCSGFRSYLIMIPQYC